MTKARKGSKQQKAEVGSGEGYVRGLKLYKGPRGESYYYHFKFNGEGFSGSCDTTSTREAVAFLEALKTELREKKKRQEHSRLSLPTLSNVYQKWVVEMTPKATAGHLRSFEVYWRKHIEPSLGHLSLNLVTTEAVEKCRALYLQGGGTNGGANSLLVAINTLFGWAIRHRIIVIKPYQVAKLRVQRIPRTILAYEVAPAFLSAIDKAKNPHVHLAVRLMLGLGLREDEALTAKWEWLNLHRREYTPGKTKGRGIRTIEVPEWLVTYLEPLKKIEGLMIPSALEPSPESGLEELPHRAGFTKKSMARAAKIIGQPGLTPHRLRATFATIHTEAGTAITEVQKMLGHLQISTTLRYVESGRQIHHEAQRKVAEAMGFQKPPVKGKGDKKGDKKPLDKSKKSKQKR